MDILERMSFDIYLIRHPQPDIAAGICYGASDLLPVQEHLEQVAAFVHAELDLPELTIYSSPLQRCTQLVEHLNLMHCIVNDFAEMGFGDWEGTAWDELPRDEVNAWREDFMHYAEHGGESVHGFHQRVTQSLEQHLITAAQDCAVFCHAGVIRSILAHCGAVAIDQGQRIELDYGGITHLSYTDRLQVQNINHAMDA